MAIWNPLSMEVLVGKTYRWFFALVTAAVPNEPCAVLGPDRCAMMGPPLDSVQLRKKRG